MAINTVKLIQQSRQVFYDRIIFNQKYILRCICEHIEHLFKTLRKILGSLLEQHCKCCRKTSVLYQPQLPPSIYGEHAARHISITSATSKRLSHILVITSIIFLSIHILRAHQFHHKTFIVTGMAGPQLPAPLFLQKECCSRIKNKINRPLKKLWRSNSKIATRIFLRH